MKIISIESAYQELNLEVSNKLYEYLNNAEYNVHLLKNYIDKCDHSETTCILKYLSKMSEAKDVICNNENNDFIIISNYMTYLMIALTKQVSNESVIGIIESTNISVTPEIEFLLIDSSDNCSTLNTEYMTFGMLCSNMASEITNKDIDTTHIMIDVYNRDTSSIVDELLSYIFGSEIRKNMADKMINNVINHLRKKDNEE